MWCTDLLHIIRLTTTKQHLLINFTFNIFEGIDNGKTYYAII